MNTLNRKQLDELLEWSTAMLKLLETNYTSTELMARPMPVSVKAATQSSPPRSKERAHHQLRSSLERVAKTSARLPTDSAAAFLQMELQICRARIERLVQLHSTSATDAR